MYRDSLNQRSLLVLANILKIKKINENAIIPKRAKLGDSGLDLCSTEKIILVPGVPTLVSTGWQMEVPLGYEIQIRPRSGLAFKNSITVPNSPGTVDCNYRGEVKVILLNLGTSDYIVEKGAKIAQMVVATVNLCEPVEVTELSETERGDGGFGSTGVI